MSYPPLPQVEQPMPGGYGQQPAPYGQQPAPYGQQPMGYGQQPMGMPMQQPHPGGEWMPAPSSMVAIPNCPPALAYLSTVDQLFIKQQFEALEMFIGFETNNKYKIKNTMNQTIFLAAEDTDCCTRNMCGPMRPFGMKIMDNAKNEIIHVDRPLACDSCLCPCWRQSIEVTCPPGTVVGTVEKDWSIMKPKFTLKDATGTTVLKIEGPLCTFSICGSVEFEVLSADGSMQIGKISKEWSGLGKEMFTDAENFGVSFPMDLDAKIKAVLIGAVFLIDYLYFEKKSN